MVSLLAPVDVARLGRVSCAWRAEAKECWASRLSALPAHALWPAHADAASPLSLLRPRDSADPVVAALAAACDAAFSLPALGCGIAHLGSESRFWLPTSDEAAAHVAAGALAGERAAACLAVCWFDVRTTLRLPPGAWLLRWRVRLVDPRMCAETFTLRCEAAADDVARVTVTPVPATLLWRDPRGRFALSWRGAADDAARLRPQAALDAAWTPRLRAAPQPDWQHLPSAVVHVSADSAPASLTVSLFKHSNQWVRGIVVDCVQAVPLAGREGSGGAAAFAPLPAAALGEPRHCPLRREAFAGLAVQPVPAGRWGAPHWATTQLLP